MFCERNALSKACLFLKLVSAQLSVCRFQIFSVSRGGIAASRFLFLLLFYLYFLLSFLCIQSFESPQKVSHSLRGCHLKLQNVVSEIMGQKGDTSRHFRGLAVIQDTAVSVECLDKRQLDKVGQHSFQGGKSHSFDPGCHISLPEGLSTDTKAVVSLTTLFRSLSSINESHLLATDTDVGECCFLSMSSHTD